MVSYLYDKTATDTTYTSNDRVVYELTDIIDNVSKDTRKPQPVFRNNPMEKRDRKW